MTQAESRKLAELVKAWKTEGNRWKWQAGEETDPDTARRMRLCGELMHRMAVQLQQAALLGDVRL